MTMLCPVGFRSPVGQIDATKSQTKSNQAFTHSQKKNWASYWASIVREYPELARLIEAWPTLPEQTKTKIKGLIERHTEEREADVERQN